MHINMYVVKIKINKEILCSFVKGFGISTVVSVNLSSYFDIQFYGHI